MRQDHNPPAFPLAFDSQQGRERGMTLRDYFAGQALAGFATAVGPAQPNTIEHFARAAYVIADAMLIERTKSEER